MIVQNENDMSLMIGEEEIERKREGMMRMRIKKRQEKSMPLMKD